MEGAYCMFMCFLLMFKIFQAAFDLDKQNDDRHNNKT